MAAHGIRRQDGTHVGRDDRQAPAHVSGTHRPRARRLLFPRRGEGLYWLVLYEEGNHRRRTRQAQTKLPSFQSSLSFSLSSLPAPSSELSRKPHPPQASHDKHLKLWSVKSGKVIRTLSLGGHSDVVYSCCFSPEGGGRRIMSAGRESVRSGSTASSDGTLTCDCCNQKTTEESSCGSLAREG